MQVPKDKVESGSGRRCWVTAEFYGETEAVVDGKAKKYFREYDPRGYDTRFLRAVRRHEDGYWFVVIQRYSTCN